jgi:DNA primase
MSGNQTKDYSIFKEVARKASIVQVIEHELGSNSLVKSGKDYKCLCPFHNDHSPSMRINVERNSFICFVDHTGGDPISFVQKYEHITPLEALKKVCQICSIPLPDEIRNHVQAVPQIEIQYKNELSALKEISLFYQTFLSTNEGKVAMDYLENRKIPKEAIEHFQLGFAPSDPTLAIKALRKNGFDVPVLEKAGILSNSSDLKDRFSFRLMYPIHDDYGHLVGFSGRKIDEDTPGGKYINYPATPLFNKSEILYHYHIARNVAKKYGYIYVVEGFNDVIAFVRAGIESCVGSMGTALTEENIHSLKRLGVEVRLCLDRDEAGQKAMEACLPLLLKAGIPFRIVRPFKGGKDADEVLKNFYPDGNEELNKEALRLYDPFLFLLARLLKSNGKNNKITDSVLVNQFVKDAKPYYLSLDPVSRINDVKALAKVTDISETSIKALLENGNVPSTASKVEKNLKDEKKETQHYLPPKKEYRSRFNQTYTGPLEMVNLVREENLPDSKFQVSNYMENLIQESLSSVAAKNLNPILIRNEVQLIYVLPHSCEAALQVESSGMSFSFLPFYFLSTWIVDIFKKNPGMVSFDKEQYNLLYKALDDYSDKKDVDDSEPFDMDGIEDGEEEAFDMDGVEDENENPESRFSDSLSSIYSMNINPDDLLFMKNAIGYISKASDNIYSREELENVLNAHRLLSQFYAREEKLRKENASLNSDSQLQKLKIEMKKLGIRY